VGLTAEAVSLSEFEPESLVNQVSPFYAFILAVFVICENILHVLLILYILY